MEEFFQIEGAKETVESLVEIINKRLKSNKRFSMKDETDSLIEIKSGISQFYQMPVRPRELHPVIFVELRFECRTVFLEQFFTSNKKHLEDDKKDEIIRHLFSKLLISVFGNGFFSSYEFILNNYKK